MTADERLVLTVSETAELLGTSERSVRRACQFEQLPALKLGRQWRIRRRDIEELLEQRRRFADIMTRFRTHAGTFGGRSRSETTR